MLNYSNVNLLKIIRLSLHKSWLLERVDFMWDDIQEFQRFKEERNAIVLAHNYQTEDIQQIADFVGDSLELCIKALESKESDIVIFCGVDFMAESAAILNPCKKVLIPDKLARCSMANMLSAEDVKKAKNKYPDAAVVLYINSLAEAKAEADIICTSANAVEIVESLPNERILFGPDKNLAGYVSQRVNKKIIPIPEHGHCYVHKMFNLQDLIFLKEIYPEAQVLVHPECDLDVQNFADKILGTNGMKQHVDSSSQDTFIICTELDMIPCLERDNPDKTFIPVTSQATCESMKLHTIEKVEECLLKEEFIVKVEEKVARRFKEVIKRMLLVSKKKPATKPIREEAYVNE